MIDGIRKYIRILWPFFIAALVFVSLKIAVRNQGMVELYYSTGLYPHIAKIFSSFSRLIPFSLWDLFWLLIILLIISGLFFVIFKKMKFRRYILLIARLLALLYSFFYILWGFNYFRPTIETRIGWEKQRTDEINFRSILDSLIIRTNLSHISVSASDYSEIDKLLEVSYQKNSQLFGISYPGGTRRPKKMLFSSVFIKLGVSGYFGPFFNEIHVNGRLLPMDYPFVLAHEKAHQFGINSEAEANLAAFIVCTTSDDLRLQYSGYILMLHYFLTDATKFDDYQDYIKKIETPVLMDLRFRQRYYRVLLNETLDKIQTAINDFYLKNNHIQDGVKNYNHVVALVISWYYNYNLRKEDK
jgi:hypothetical protein